MPSEIIPSETKKIRFGCENLYITVGHENHKPVQVLMVAGKAGCCQRVLVEAVCRLVNQLLDDGKPIEEVVECLAGMQCDQGMAGVGRLSCVDALARMLKGYAVAKAEGGPT